MCLLLKVGNVSVMSVMCLRCGVSFVILFVGVISMLKLFLLLVFICLRNLLSVRIGCVFFGSVLFLMGKVYVLFLIKLVFF